MCVCLSVCLSARLVNGWFINRVCASTVLTALEPLPCHSLSSIYRALPPMPVFNLTSSTMEQTVASSTTWFVYMNTNTSLIHAIIRVVNHLLVSHAVTDSRKLTTLLIICCRCRKVTVSKTTPSYFHYFILKC